MYLRKPSLAKYWIVSGDDPDCMYAKLAGEEVSLWCDKRVTESVEKKQHALDGRLNDLPLMPSKRSTKSTNYALCEDEIEELTSEIWQNRGDTLISPVQVMGPSHK